MAAFDVLIAGSGAAGCSAAIALGDLAPDLRVCVVSGGPRQRIALGETLPPLATRILKHLGVYERFEADRHPKTFRTLSAWGSRALLANEFLFGVHQFGWSLDRARFDAMLAERAMERGAHWTQAKVAGLARDHDRWTVLCDDGSQIAARFVLDATGRPAVLSQFAAGARAARRDRLIGCLVRFDGPARMDLTVEAFADGWWFSTPLPDGGTVVACMSDSDIVKSRGLADMATWSARLEETHFMRDTMAGATAAGPPRILPAGSCIRSLRADTPFLALGDAASCFDPLSSQGIVKAMRSGVFAAYAAFDFLARDDPRGLSRYRLFVQREFAAYMRTLRDYYSRERRWSDRPFWQRRLAPRPAAAEPGAQSSSALRPSPDVAS